MAVPPDVLAPNSAATRRAQRVPRRWALRPSDVLLIFAANALLIVGMWVRHGQFPNLTHPAAVLTGAGQLAALLGTYCALVQVVLMSRSPWLDDLFGIDRITGWHRWLGFATVLLICGHVVLTTAGYAMTDGRSFATQTWVFLTTYPYMLMAYVAAALLVIAFRVVIPLRMAQRHHLRVHHLVTESPNVLSIYITGRDLDQLPMRAGQFFKFRFLTRELWWRVHPFSLSAAPNGRYLRITVKQVGDFTRSLKGLRPGTPVLLEGPHGIFTSIRRKRPRALLIAGGIGITPLRALIEEMPQRKNSIALLYRASSWNDVIFKEELDQLVAARGGVIHYIVGRRGKDVHPQPFAPRFLSAFVPDLRDRDVFVCGPREMIDAVITSLRALRVPAAQVHCERFAFLT